ncbi:site-specific integrase [Acidovorax sp. Leaf78]|uniref:site-specific integrase n=1 Tax=Acidovorax sp. Leaf78 TaxID=1736237 RepID=UPI0006F27FA9|nr:site-specific integrase [Acidovorax sp. Leaf78]KQO23460.1 hypothetical protein ASF16_04675 [Acidovorax sp. Leaf78]
MGTITARKRADGTTSYTAQIRIKRDGKVIHSEAQTFSRRALADEWKRRRESELEAVRASGRPLAKGVTLETLIADYVSAAENVTAWGRSKTADINRLKRSGLAAKDATKLTALDFMEHARLRRSVDGAGPATVLNDLVWLRQVLMQAAIGRDLPAPLVALDRAREELLRVRVVAKAKQRSRRLLADEEAKLLAHFESRDARADIPMADIVRFALSSTRRQDEICRLRWADVDDKNGVAWLDDVKHPRHKKGNRRKFRLLKSALEIIQRQSKVKGEGADLVFPFNARSVSAAFTRSCKLLGIEGLHFHDLRHEATSRLFERGYSIQEVAQFTLHESWATLKRYTHLQPENVPER